MDLKEFYNNLKLFYKKTSEVFEKLFTTYFFVCYDISEYEKVYVVEDSFIVYFGIKKTRELTEDIINYYFENDYGVFNTLIGHLLVVEELTYNENFKINATKLRKDIFGKDAPYAPYIYKFFNADLNKPIKNLNLLEEENYYAGERDYWKTNFHNVNNILPFLELEERIKAWKGVPHTFILYEVEYNNKKGYAVNSTGSPYTTKYALNSIRDIEKSTRNTWLSFREKDVNLEESNEPFYIVDNIEGYISYSFPYSLRQDYSYKIVCWNDVLFRDILMKKLKDYCEENHIKKIGDIECPNFIPDGFLKYWIIQDYVKTTYFPEKYIDIILNKDKYILDAKEFANYHKSEKRWKSEELMYEYVKKIFAKNEVVHQHRPYFLHTKNGQMSYDVFVYGEKIAFEYQGKQHFEPVEYFGGEGHFEEQRKRDELKLKLSEENGIVLIYVNYWEDISIDLIKEKVIDAFKQRGNMNNKYYLK